MDDINPHIVSSFDADLRELTRRVTEMGGLAEALVADAIQSLADLDPERAASVAPRDREIDSAETELNEATLRILAQRQPLARDLRETVAAVKVASTLERIGDLAKSTARRVPAIIENPAMQFMPPLLAMGREAHKLLGAALDAYGRKDAGRAAEVWRGDEPIDNLYYSLFRELIRTMENNSSDVVSCAILMPMAKNFERIGDHATFVAEMTYFIVEGGEIGDDRPKGDPATIFTTTGNGNGDDVV